MRSDSPVLARRAHDDARDAELLRAALELLVETGYDALTIDGLARHAHVSKATIYRRWSGKADLIVDALQLGTQAFTGCQDRGSLRADLIELARSLDTSDENSFAIITATAHAVRGDAELATAIKERLTDPMRVACRAIVQRAIVRGEIPAAAHDLRIFPDLLPSMILGRVLFPHPGEAARPLSEIVDTVLLPVLRAAGSEAAHVHDLDPTASENAPIDKGEV